MADRAVIKEYATEIYAAAMQLYVATYRATGNQSRRPAKMNVALFDECLASAVAYFDRVQEQFPVRPITPARKLGRINP